MASQEQRLRKLLRQFADNLLTDEEIKEMLALIRKNKGEEDLEELLGELRKEFYSQNREQLVNWENLWEKISDSSLSSSIQKDKKNPIIKMKWLRVAVVLIPLFAVAAFYFTRNSDNQKKEAQIESPERVTNDVEPGGARAILTLSNGAQINLDNAAKGTLAHEGGTEIVKLEDGKLMYRVASSESMQVMYNTVTTPKGGEYSLVLPDGSRAWLNSISSIRYPTVFTGNERRVEITGEVYLEVTKNESLPFKVVVNPSHPEHLMEVFVLGTHFNINAYDDEPSINTTLIEGKVRVQKGNSSSIIQPGNQAQVMKEGKIKVMSDADISEVMAWKNGRFEFNDDDLKTILRQLMRWYDVEVEYRGPVSDRYFTAAISRRKALSSVLKILKYSGIDFQLEGRKLIVKP